MAFPPPLKSEPEPPATKPGPLEPKLTDRNRGVWFPNRHWEAMRHNQQSNEAGRQTIKRRRDEPKLEIGATITMKEGLVGVILARYTPSGGRNEIHYIVETKPGKTEDGETGKAHEEDLPL